MTGTESEVGDLVDDKIRLMNEVNVLRHDLAVARTIIRSAAEYLGPSADWLNEKIAEFLDDTA